jgi:hypothetical protein
MGSFHKGLLVGVIVGAVGYHIYANRQAGGK